MKVEEIGTLEAKTHLSTLLNEVLNGKSFYLTRHGKRVAELRPIQEAAKPLSQENDRDLREGKFFTRNISKQ